MSTAVFTCRFFVFICLSVISVTPGHLISSKYNLETSRSLPIFMV